MRMHRSATVGLMVIALSGAWVSAQAPISGYPAVGAPPIVTIQSAGSEPRRPLRYAFVKGRDEVMALDMAMGMTMDMAGMAMPEIQMPPMHMVAKSSVMDVLANGDALTSVTFTDMSLVNSAGVDPALAGMLQSSLADIKNVPSTATMTNRGIMRDSKFDVTKVANPQLSQMLSAMASTMESLSVPLPEEAVGVGAKWTVRLAAPSNGLTIYQEFQTELLSIDDHGCKLGMRLTQTAPQQPVHNGMMPAGVQATLDRLEGSGSGTKSLRFDSLVPTGDISSKTLTVMSVDAGTGSQQIGVTVTLKVTVAPVK